MIRHCRLKDPETAARRAKDSSVPLLRQVPGFYEYYVVHGAGNASAVVAVFETREGAEEERRLSDQWSREHLEEPLEPAGESMDGETVIAEMAEPTREGRRAA